MARSAMPSPYRSLHDPDVQDELSRVPVAPEPPQIDIARAQTLARSTGNPAARATGERMLAESERQRENDARQAESAARTQEREQERMRKEADDAAEARRARDVRAGAADGQKTVTDIETGKRTIATHPDGSPVYRPGPVGDPVEKPTIDKNLGTAPGLGDVINSGELGRPTNYTGKELVQTYRNDRGQETDLPLPSQTDPKTGAVTIESGKDEFGAPRNVHLGTDMEAAARAQKAAELEQRRGELSLRGNTLKQARHQFTPRWEPVRKEFEEAKRNYESFNTGEKGEGFFFKRNTYKNQSTNKDEVAWMKVDKKTGREEIATAQEVVNHRKALETARNRYVAARRERDKMLPFAENLKRNEGELELASLKLREEEQRHAMGLPEDDGGISRILAAEAGELDTTPEKQAAEQVASFAREAAAAPEYDPERDGPVELAAPPPPNTFDALQNLEGMSVKDQGSFTSLWRGGRWIASLEDQDGKTPFVTLRDEAHSQSDVSRIVADAKAGVPIYLRDNPERSKPAGEAQLVAGVFQSLQESAGSDPQSIATMLREKGLGPVDIRKQVTDGRMSVQTGRTLLSGLWGDKLETDSIDPAGFRAWLAGNKDAAKRWQEASSAGFGYSISGQEQVWMDYVKSHAIQNAGRPGMDRETFKSLYAQNPKQSGTGAKISSAANKLGKILVNDVAGSMVGLIAGGVGDLSYAEAALFGSENAKKELGERMRLRNRDTANWTEAAKRNAKVWATKEGAAASQELKNALTVLQSSIDDEAGKASPDRARIDAAEMQVREAALAMHELSRDEAWPVTLDTLDPNKDGTLGSALAEYSATADPRAFALYRDRLLMSNGRRQHSREIEERYGNQGNGFFGSVARAQSVGWQELGSEMVADAVAIGTAGGSKALQAALKATGAVGKAARVERAAAKASKALESAWNMGMKRGTLQNPLTAGQKARNVGTRIVQGGVAEGLEESIVEPGSDSPDFLESFLVGTLGGITLAPAAAIAAEMRNGSPATPDQSTAKQNESFAQAYNARNAGTPGFQPVTPAAVGVSRMFENAAATESGKQSIRQAIESHNAASGSTAADAAARDMARQELGNAVAGLAERTDDAIQAASAIEALADPAQRTFFTGIAKVAAGNAQNLTNNERRAIQGARTQEGADFFEATENQDGTIRESLTAEAKQELATTMPAVARLAGWTPPPAPINQPTPIHEQNPQGQPGQQAPPETPQPAPADAIAPGGAVSGGSGQPAPAAPDGAGGQAPAPQAAVAPNLAAMDAGEYAAYQQAEPSAADIPTLVTDAFAAGRPVSVSMARESGVQAPQGYTRQGAMFVPPVSPPNSGTSPANSGSYPKTREKAEGARALAEAAVSRANQRFPKLGATFTFEDTESPVRTGGAYATGEGITINVPDLERDLSGYAEDQRDARVDAILEEEIIHLAQFEAVRRMGVDAREFYASLWDDFTPGQKSAAESAYQATFAEMEPWQQAAETVRMLIQERADGRVTELSKAFSRNMPERLVKLLQEAVRFLKSIVESGEIAPRIQSAIDGIESILAEYADGNRGTASPPAAPEPTVLQTTGQAITAALERYPQLAGDRALKTSLYDLTGDLAEVMEGMPAAERAGFIEQSVQDWADELDLEGKARAAEELGKRNAARAERARQAKDAARARLREKARAILNSDVYSALSSIFERGRITPKPKVIPLILARKKAGMKLTEKEIGTLRNLSDWDGAPRKQDYPGGGNHVVIREIIDMLTADPGKGQMPNVMADNLTPGVTTASEMFEAIDREFRAIANGTAVSDHRDDPNREWTDEEIAAELERNQPETPPAPTLEAARAEAAEAFGENADIVGKIDVLADLSDRFDDETRPHVLAAVFAELDRIHLDVVSAASYLERVNPFSEMAAKFQRFMDTHTPDSMRERLESMPVMEPEPAMPDFLRSSPSPSGDLFDNLEPGPLAKFKENAGKAYAAAKNDTARANIAKRVLDREGVTKTGIGQGQRSFDFGTSGGFHTANQRGFEFPTVDDKANDAATSEANSTPQPTDAQKQAGNYKVGRVRIGGMDISIENPAGSVRSGTAANGSRWEVTMASHYGYVRSAYRPSSKRLAQSPVAHSYVTSDAAKALSSLHPRIDVGEVVGMLVSGINTLDRSRSKELSERIGRNSKLSRGSITAKATRHELRSFLKIPPDLPRAHVNAELNKAGADWLAADSQLFGDGSNAKSIRSHGYDSLSIERKRVVKSSVFAAVQNRQILRSIVQLIPVDVMDMLITGEFSTENLLHNNPMLLERFSASLDDPVLIGRIIDSVATNLPVAFAARIAEEVSPRNDSVIRPAKNGIAAGAKDNRHRREGRRVSTKGKDGDHIDIFIQQGTPESYAGPVFVVNQMNADGSFDEHKAVLGPDIDTEAKARAEYLRNYSPGWNGAGTIARYESVEAFKDWATEKRRIAPARSSPPSPMDRRNADSRELFPEDGGFRLSQETTQDGAKITAERDSREEAKAANERAQGTLYSSPARSAPVNIPDAVVLHQLGATADHPAYKAGKGGDPRAALSLAIDLITEKEMQAVESMIGTSKPIVVPVLAIEESGRNMIPLAAANRIAHGIGLDITEEIIQSVKANRSGKTALDRVFSQAAFDGPVIAGADYLMVDDTLTQGGTFAALAGHIHDAGGRVIGAVALTGKQYSATLRLSDGLLSEIREKFGDVENDFSRATGHGYDRLTESEARALVRFRPADAVRSRIIAEADGKGIGLDEGRTGERLSASPSPEQTAAVQAALAAMGPRMVAVYQAAQANRSTESIMKEFGVTERGIANAVNQVRARIQVALKAASKEGLQPEMRDGLIDGGRPDLGLGANKQMAATDQIRNESGIPDVRPRNEVIADAEALIAKDYEGTIEFIMNAARKRTGLEDTYVAAAKIILGREMLSGKFKSKAEQVKLGMLAYSYRETGKDDARSLAMRYDPHMKPAERHAQFIAEALTTPDAATRKRMREHPRQAEEILTRWLDRTSAIKAELLAQGIDIDASLAEFNRRNEDRRQAEEESPRMKAALETTIRKLSPIEKSVVETIRSGALVSSVVNTTGLPVSEIREIWQHFVTDFESNVRESVKRFMAAALGSSPTDLMSRLKAEFGIFDWDVIDDTRDGWTDRREEIKNPRPPRQPKPKQPKAPQIPDLTPEQQAELDAAFERFRNADPSTWSTLFQTESERLAPMIGQTAFERWRGEALEPWRDLWQTEMEAITDPAGRMTFDEWVSRPRATWTAKQAELFEEQRQPVNETRGTFDIHDPVSVKRVVDAFAIARGSKMDALMEYWRASILTGPQTHIVNAGSNALHMAFDLLPRRGVEATINTILGIAGQGSEKGATFGEFAPMARNLRRGVQLAARNALRSWQLETRTFEAYARAEAIQLDFTGVGAEYIPPALGGKLGKIMRSLSFRAMTAADEFFKSLYAQMETAAQAHRIAAVEEKLKGERYSARVDELMKPGSIAWLRAIDGAKLVTFQEDINGDDPRAIRRLDQLAQLVKTGRNMPWIGRPLTFFVPFVDTPLNVFKQAVEMSPLGTALSVIDGTRALKRRILSGRMTKEEARAEAAKLYDRARLVHDLTNQTIGWAAFFALEGLTGSDGDDEDGRPVITGTVPYKTTKRGERDNAYAVMAPMSIRVGNTVFSYQRIEPFATVLASLVDLHVATARQGGFNSAVSSEWLANFKDQVQDKTFLQGLASLFNALDDPDRFAERLTANIATGFAPNLIRQPIREVDPKIRDTSPRAGDGFFTSLGKSVGFSIVPQAAPAKLSVWGEEIPQNRGASYPGEAFFRVLDPTNMQFGTRPDSLDKWIFRYNLATADSADRIAIQPIPNYLDVTMPGERNRKRFPLTPEEQAEANRHAGRSALAALQADWENIPLAPEHAERIIDTVRAAQRDVRASLRMRKLAENTGEE